MEACSRTSCRRLASVWYYFRETDYQHIKDLWDIGNKIAQAAAAMTDTKVTWRLLSAAWPQHMNKPVAEATQANIKRVGLPAWDADQRWRRRQRELSRPRNAGLQTRSGNWASPPRPNGTWAADRTTSATSPGPCRRSRCATRRNIPGLPGHHWASAIAEATPIAHKGVVAGAKVQAMTMLDLLLKPELVQQARNYFKTVQNKDEHYTPLVSAEDKPPIWLNKRLMDEIRPEMRNILPTTRRSTRHISSSSGFPIRHRPSEWKGLRAED